MSLRSRLTTDPRALAVGDSLALLAVLLAGEVHHYGVGRLTAVGAMAPTLLSFVLGWLLVATLLGVYERTPDGRARHSLRLVVGTWLGAANVGLLVRGSVFDDPAAYPFPLVVTGLTLVGLVAWRGIVAYVADDTGFRSVAAGERDAQH
jgi:hypothetical protein